MRALLVASLAVAAGVAWQPPQPSSNLWDVSAGVTVLAHSHLDEPGYDIRDMFGAELSPFELERGNVVFRDGAGAGSVDFVEWQTRAVVKVGTVKLTYEDDSPAANWRNLKEFRLYGWNSLLSTWEPLLSRNTPLQAGFHVEEMTIADPKPYVRFRAEFVRGAASNPRCDAPRIVELEAFTAPSRN